MVAYRRARPSDEPALHDVFLRAFVDLEDRLVPGGAEDGAALPAYVAWDRLRPMFEHLSATAAESWVAEADGHVAGYARSILRDGVLQLTEYFVAPDAQSLGVGRALLERAFPASAEWRRLVVGTPDVRAVARYLKAGLDLLAPCPAFHRPAERCAVSTDLTTRPLDPDRDAGVVATIDRAVLGYARPEDHVWLGRDRPGWLLVRGGSPVGYAYAGDESGPAALLEAHDVPAALALLETAQAEAGNEFMVRVPTLNTAAVRHLLARGCQIEPLFAFLYAEAPLPGLDRFVLTVPEFPL